MKTCVIALLFCLTGFALNGQGFAAPDTLIQEHFETDPTSDMLEIPSGDDQLWVNYDADQLTGLCVEPPATTPGGWYWEGSFDPSDPSNSALTSCSFLIDPFKKTENWLITPPIEIPDDSYWLFWRSLSYYGPGFLDGYKVLVSTSSNDPATNAFSHTLFTAAEMIENSSPTGSLDPGQYVFSSGYIHANGYTDTTFYFVDNSQGDPFFHGKFEPHKVSLAGFTGDTIYIAFLHDSQDDFILQIDDIVVTKSLPTHVLLNVLYFNVSPNPVRDAAYFSFKLNTAEEGRLLVADNAGKLVAQQSFNTRSEGRIFFETYNWAPGIYYCTLETATGRATTKLVKI